MQGLLEFCHDFKVQHLMQPLNTTFQLFKAARLWCFELVTVTGCQKGIRNIDLYVALCELHKMVAQLNILLLIFEKRTLSIISTIFF